MQKNFKLAWQNPLEKNNSNENAITSMDQSKIIEKIIKNTAAIQNKIIVLKLPCSILNNKELFANFIKNIQLLKTIQVKFIIIHDYTSLEKNIKKFFSINTEKYLSQISDNKSIDIAEMIISGNINKQIVSKFCESGIPAIGISGKDNNLIIAKKLKKKSIYNDSIKKEIFIGEPLIVNSDILAILEDSDVVTIISPIAQNENGKTVILDTDSTASMICSSIVADYFIILDDQNQFSKTYVKLEDSFELHKWIHNNQLPVNNPIIKAIGQVMYSISAASYIINSNHPDGLILKYTFLICLRRMKNLISLIQKIELGSS